MPEFNGYALISVFVIGFVVAVVIWLNKNAPKRECPHGTEGGVKKCGACQADESL